MKPQFGWGRSMAVGWHDVMRKLPEHDPERWKSVFGKDHAQIEDERQV
jgi:hypothetical protein